MINVHVKDDGTQTRDPEMHELNEIPDEDYIAQISRFVSLKTDRDKTPYKKIEMFWPHPLQVMPTYPSPKSTLTLTSHLKQNVGLGEG